MNGTPWPHSWRSGILILAALVLAIKFLVRRQRPEGEWGAIYRNTDPHSFPSGHAARAVLLAGLFWARGHPAVGLDTGHLGAAGEPGAREHGRTLPGGRDRRLAAWTGHDPGAVGFAASVPLTISLRFFTIIVSTRASQLKAIEI